MSLQTVSETEDSLTSKATIEKFLPYFRDSLLSITDFEPIRIVGEGAFALVYKCRQLSTGAFVAVKVLKQHVLSREQDVYDFLLEAQLLHKLKHPSIIGFKGICYGQLNAKHTFESICVVTEFMESGSLKTWIQANTRQPDKPMYGQRSALRWMIQVAEGMEYLHCRKFAIIHRDLKPENILLHTSSEHADEYDAKIADFGLSVIVASRMSHKGTLEPLSELEQMDSDALPDLLKHGRQKPKKNAESLQKALAGASFVIRSDAEHHFNGIASKSSKYLMTGKTGSLLYMSPEVLRSNMYNEKIDVFSLATVIYETLLGIRLSTRFGMHFTVKEVQKFAEEVRDGYRLPLPEEWPEELKELLVECWKGKPQVLNS